MQDFETVCLISFASSVPSSGRKDGEGGIMFDNEDEKEQWEEDQKVSGCIFSLLCLIKIDYFLVVLYVFFFFDNSYIVTFTAS